MWLWVLALAAPSASSRCGKKVNKVEVIKRALHRKGGDSVAHNCSSIFI